MSSTFAALTAVALPLAATVCIETPVAALLGLPRKDLVAVVWINFVTNPVLNLVWLFLFWSGLGYATIRTVNPPAGVHTVHPWMWLVLGALEVMVILAEWRLLLAVLGPERSTPRKLLAVSIAMNAVSATLGTMLLSRLG
jgi:hypothetical protein